MTRTTTSWELLEQGIPKRHITKLLISVSRRIIIRWSQAIHEHGDLQSYLDRHKQAKTG